MTPTQKNKRMLKVYFSTQIYKNSSDWAFSLFLEYKYHMVTIFERNLVTNTTDFNFKEDDRVISAIPDHWKRVL